jgi:hypothetical protein
MRAVGDTPLVPVRLVVRGAAGTQRPRALSLAH